MGFLCKKKIMDIIIYVNETCIDSLLVEQQKPSTSCDDCK